MQLLRKLYQNYMKKDSKAADGAKEDGSKKDEKDTGNEKGRKANFFERKRFVNYEPNE